MFYNKEKKETKNMLKSFSVENYKSFNKKIVFDLSNVSDYQFNTDCIRNSLLNKSIIFGVNGSGKSNLGLAIFDIIQVLTDKNLDRKMLDPISFLNINNSLPYAEFSYTFQFQNNNVEYVYRKSTPTTLIYEELKVNGVTAFICDFEKNEITSFSANVINASNLSIDAFHGDISFLRYINANASLPQNNIIREIMDFVNGMLWFRSLQENGYIGLQTGAETLVSWIANNGYALDFQDFLKKIANLDFEFETGIQEALIPAKTLLVKGTTKKIYFDSTASTGTNALMLLYYWIKHFDKVKFVFMDEFDAFYHFELAKNVLNFIIINYPEIQTVFTSHNTVLATNQLLRPDCCLTLVNGELKSFKDRTTRELRESHNLEKLLRSGEFDEE